MHKIRRIFIVTIFVLCFSAFAKAQGGVSYEFLEVVDSENKPVADAVVKTQGSCFDRENKTNEKGRLDKGLPICYGDYHTDGFTVSKDGYFTYESIYTPKIIVQSMDKRFYEPTGGKDGIRIELLKIPRMDVERKAVGSEQLKRELFSAVKYGKTDEAIKLFKAGVSPNLTTSDLRGVSAPRNIPAIVYAAAFADVKMIKAFLDAGADIRKKDSPARSILLTYLRNNADSLRYSRFGSRRTEEERANPMRFFEEGLDILVKAGADIEAVDKGGDTALTIAVRQGYVGVLKRLLALNYSRKTKSEALQYLIYWKNADEPHALEFMDLLLKSDADPNFIIENSQYFPSRGCASLLMLASELGKTDYVKLLLANKADPNLKCKDGKTAVVTALEGQHPEAAKMLLDAGADGTGFGKYHRRTALMVAAAKGDIDVVKMLLAKGFSVKDRDEWHESALEIAIDGKASREMIEFLLKAGADPNGQTSPYCTIPLTYSNALGKPDIVRLLIAYKADVNLKCGGYDTAIVYAAKYGDTEAVKTLLEAGADIKGEQGQRALNYAKENLKSDYAIARSKAEEIVKILEAAGVK